MNVYQLRINTGVIQVKIKITESNSWLGGRTNRDLQNFNLTA